MIVDDHDIVQGIDRVVSEMEARRFDPDFRFSVWHLEIWKEISKLPGSDQTPFRDRIVKAMESRSKHLFSSRQIEVNGASYTCHHLKRGQVRQIEAEADSSKQADLLVQMTVGDGIDIEELPMPDYIAISQWAVRHNGLDGDVIGDAKKN